MANNVNDGMDNEKFYHKIVNDHWSDKHAQNPKSRSSDEDVYRTMQEWLRNHPPSTPPPVDGRKPNAPSLPPNPPARRPSKPNTGTWV